jgi:hypothetical protein
MFCDTNDSRLRLAVIDQLNSLPGVHVAFTPADGRRAEAVDNLAALGPAAKAALPALIEALKRQTSVRRQTEGQVLVRICHLAWEERPIAEGRSLSIENRAFHIFHWRPQGRSGGGKGRGKQGLGEGVSKTC